MHDIILALASSPDMGGLPAFCCILHGNGKMLWVLVSSLLGMI